MELWKIVPEAPLSGLTIDHSTFISHYSVSSCILVDTVMDIMDMEEDGAPALNIGGYNIGSEPCSQTLFSSMAYESFDALAAGLKALIASHLSFLCLFFSFFFFFFFFFVSFFFSRDARSQIPSERERLAR